MRLFVSVFAGYIVLAASTGLTFAQTFDGKWAMSVVGGANCPIKSAEYEITIDGSRAWKSSSGVKWTGTVKASGLLQLSGPTPSGSGNLMKIRGQLTGNKGEGRINVSGGMCKGAFTMTKR